MKSKSRSRLNAANPTTNRLKPMPYTLELKTRGISMWNIRNRIVTK